MSFSADWLSLREPADHAARDAGLVRKLAEWGAGRSLRITDLGSGTGSTFRALAEAVPGRWTMVEIDRGLLTRLWAAHGDDPRVAEGLPLDLATQLDEVWKTDPDLVSGSALIDLASAQWLDALADGLPDRTALYMALSYDGKETWRPAPPHEERALAAFHAHQAGDKGFGAALGPDATTYLAERLAARGWNVSIARSDWRLAPEDGPLIRELAAGSIQAVEETGALPAQALSDWAEGRLAASHVEIGHLDLLALPPV
ncbi:hypothetical protein [Pontivivens insulae]|uniref:Trans-aconitate 2-methyltransferase n=1 Tax=Pontivivens insulae TaxID=1639689 RepID=A0A2R8AF45_9RHOB|nr:hypothetical protein [Pontivivens insulae]RED12108.1 hypothetical protein DFR53_2821 [Pontivivens insulae]SPF30864.1 hypothetical protein POI8812_03208 [Pontivivens insulae]